MTLMYRLKSDGKTPVPCSTIEWAKAIDSGAFTVASDTTPNNVKVSTIFLGVGDPPLWETKVFGGPLDGETDRYASHDEALAGHKVMLVRVLVESPGTVEREATSPTHVEIHGGILKCECGHETELFENTMGGTLHGPLVACPEHVCAGCGRTWGTPATADCELLEDAPR